jgi:acyl-CoA thioesterase
LIAAAMNRFDRDTALERTSQTSFRGTVDRGWWIIAGPNGGYIAAILLRALMACVDDLARTPRSLTIHYLRPPTEGPFDVHTCLERRGGRLSTATARMEQDGRVLAIATGAFSTGRPGLEFAEHRAPEVPAPEELPAWDRGGAGTIPFHERYELRPCVGQTLFSGSDSAHSGGWIRLAEPRALDYLLLAALTDAWPPAVFTRLAPDQPGLGVPTVDLTIHFREPLETLAADPQEFYLVHFRTLGARDGFLEEDGEVYSRDGRLLAQSRQLAILV